MIKKLCPRYNPSSRDMLSNHLIPAWYKVEKDNSISELKDVPKAAITADGCTSLNQDHYLTVTLHYFREGINKGRVLQTKAVYEAQTGAAVAEEIGNILDQFKVREKVMAATVDNAGNMDMAVKMQNSKDRVLCPYTEPCSTEDPEMPNCVKLGCKSPGSCGVDEEVPHGQSCPQRGAATPQLQ